MTSAPLVASLLAACAVLAAAGAVASAGSTSPAIALPAPRGPSATVFPRDRRVEMRPLSWLPFARSRREARRRAAIDAEVTQLLDLVAASSSAGLSASLSLRRAAEALRGPLGAELLSAFAAVDLGARWRDELTALAERGGSPDLRRTVAALIRTETLGSSLVDATRDLADDVRRARRAARMERARAAPVKMLFPLVFLVLPAFLLLTVVPVLLTTLRSIG